MARKVSKTLTDGELRIMDVIWHLKKASAKEVTQVLQRQEKVAYTTVQTILRILEVKGFVRHQKLGRSFIYSAIVQRSKARKAELKNLLSRFFNDNPESLVLNLLEEEFLDAADIQELEEAIQKEK